MSKVSDLKVLKQNAGRDAQNPESAVEGEKEGSDPSVRPFEGRWAVDGRGCWVWKGKPDRDGYGRCKVEGRGMQAHKAVWEALRGPITAERQLHHACPCGAPNRRCVNPDHLELLTPEEHRAAHAPRRGGDADGPLTTVGGSSLTTVQPIPLPTFPDWLARDGGLAAEVRTLREELAEIRSGVDAGGPLVTVDVAGRMLGCGRTRVFELIRAAKLKRGRSVGKTTMITRESVEALGESKRRASPGAKRDDIVRGRIRGIAL
jgi:hypothetical protein